MKKIAILHEMLIKLGGAEKIVETFLEIFPNASLFTLIYDEKKVGKIFPKEKINPQVFNLPSQKRYNLFKKQRFSLPQMAISIEQLDFREYDIVLCSSSGFAHGALTKPETKFIVYYHSPAGYMWHETHNYLNLILKNKNFILKILLKYYITKNLNKLRIWDFIASNRCDIRIAASKDSKRRIEKYYKKKVDKVIFPSVEVEFFMNNNYKTKDYYLSIGALTESKRFEILIENFNKMPQKKLKIIGDGHLKNKLKKLIKNNNIELVGYKNKEEIKKLIGESKGGIFCGVEDFGIAAIECLASSKPIFCLEKGGYKETNIAGVTGEFYKDSEGSDFIEKFKIFEKRINSNFYKKENFISQAKKFSKENFKKEILELINI